MRNIGKWFLSALGAVALLILPAQIVIPPPNSLTATPNLNLYVATTGSDANNSCTSVGTPCATVQAAVNQAVAYNIANGTAQINVAAGTYSVAGPVAVCSGTIVGTARGAVDPGVISIVGAGSATTTFTSTAGASNIIASDVCQIFVQKVRLTSTTGSLLFPQRDARIGVLTDVNFGASALGQLHSEMGGIIEINASYTISGGSTAHIQPRLGGRVFFDEINNTVTLTGTPAFSTAFADVADAGSLAYIPSANITFSGAATGPRASIRDNGLVQTNAGTGTYLPGNSNVSYARGGVYSPMPTPTAGTPSGAGTGATAAIVSGGTDHAFFLQLTAGTTPGATLTQPITFGGNLPNGACTLVTNNGTGSFVTNAATQTSSFSASSFNAIVFNQGTNFVAGSTYFLIVTCNN